MRGGVLRHRVLVLCAAAMLPAIAFAQGTLEDYQRAERFLTANVRKLVFEGQVGANWIGRSSRFWYRNDKPDGKEFILVDAEAATRAPAFDHQRLAAGLSRATKKDHKAAELPFNTFQFVDENRAIEFEVETERWRCALDTYECKAREPRQRGPRLNVPSPDGKLIADVRDHNLFIRVAATGEEFPLSRDGELHYDYAQPLPSPTLMLQQRSEQVTQPPAVFWSPDSKRLVTYVMDQRNFPRLTMTQSAPPDRFRPFGVHYAYPLPVDARLPAATLVIFDLERRVPVTVQARPIELYYYGGPRVIWFSDSKRFHYREIDRGYTAVRLLEVDAASGATRVLIEETSDTSVNVSVSTSRMMGEQARMLWSSERDGWNHLYVYDLKTGDARQLTRGEWVVRQIVDVDEKAGRVFFMAGGREAGRDPYLRHLYRINLDGTGLALLTPEDADHNVSFSPDNKFFVDSYSRPDLPGTAVLRRSEDGSVVMNLEKVDIARLQATGWKFPEPFKAKGRDGSTDVYGLIWRPSNFDPKKKYPVVETIYTGPHGAFVPKTFAAYRHHAQAIAELGFICVMVDGMGTALRSKAFHDASYKNLGDGGLDDHIAALRQMARKYPQMDLDRVGIWGHSAGGYDSTHALLTRPDFYKVAVSSAGNHDHRMDKAWWNESWMGTPAGPHYEAQSNVTLAKNLKGKLLLAHGDVDENVPIAATLKLADALIAANKDFDLIVMPNRNHGFGNDPYFIRRRWDFFVRHLLGVAPPEGFRIGAETEARETTSPEAPGSPN